MAVWLSGLVPFEQAAQILLRVGAIALTDSTLWRQTAHWGQRFEAVEAHQVTRATALPARGPVVRGEARGQPPLGVALDGAMIHVRREGWKELKTGCVFAIALRTDKDPLTGEAVELAHAVQNSYVAHLGEPAPFGRQLWAEAQRRHWTRATDSIAIGDGAVWVWNLVKEHFYDSRQAVDWYHASTHLRQAAEALHGEGTHLAEAWYRDQATRLYQGHAADLAADLAQCAPAHPSVQEELERQAGYFREHARRMQYLELREDGFPLGSGMVESGCKQFRARFVGPGMRWSRTGAERLLPVRAAIMSERFDQLWHQAQHLPPN